MSVMGFIIFRLLLLVGSAYALLLLNRWFGMTQNIYSKKESIKLWNIWHARLGHMNMDGTKRLIQSGAVVLKPDATPARHSAECSSCMKGKQKKQRIRPNMSRSPTRCALIHSDVCGPMSVESFLGCRYFVIFYG